MQLPISTHECIQDLQLTALSPYKLTWSRLTLFPSLKPLPPLAAAFNDSVQDLQALEAKFQEAYKAPEIDLHAGACVDVCTAGEAVAGRTCRRRTRHLRSTCTQMRVV